MGTETTIGENQQMENSVKEGVERDGIAGVTPFGHGLRRWRHARGFSQLELAARAGSTSRHVSFLETGRSRPSQEMVLRLSQVLDVPLEYRNDLLEAAGLAPVYPNQGLGSIDLAPHRKTLERMLSVHEPYPGLVLTHRWDVLLANKPAHRLFGEDIVGENLVRRQYTNPDVHKLIANWPQIAMGGLERLRRQHQASPLDDELADLVELAEGVVAHLDVPNVMDPQPLLCPTFRVGDAVVSTIGMAAQFNNPHDAGLAGLTVELLFPADEASELFFQQPNR